MATKKKGITFRKEAIEHFTRRHGQVIIATPLSFFMFTGFILLITAFTFLFLGNRSYTNHFTVSGLLDAESGSFSIKGSQSGYVEALYVKENQIVKKGDILCSVKTDLSSNSQSVNSQVIESMKKSISVIRRKIQFQKELVQIEKAQVIKDNRRIMEESERIRKEIALRTEYLAVISDELSAIANLYKRRMATKTEHNAKAAQLLEAKLALQQLNRELQSSLNKISENDDLVLTLNSKSESQILNYEESIDSIEREITVALGNISYEIAAPRDGVIANVLFEQGSYIDSTSTILVILPEQSDLVAKIYIPSEGIGRVKEGQEVVLRYDAFPYQKFGLHRGKILHISQTLIQPDQVNVSGLVEDPSYRAIVQLDSQSVLTKSGEAIQLQTGMFLEADLVGQTRSLLAWIFDPLLKYWS